MTNQVEFQLNTQGERVPQEELRLLLRNTCLYFDAALAGWIQDGKVKMIEEGFLNDVPPVTELEGSAFVRNIRENGDVTQVAAEEFPMDTAEDMNWTAGVKVRTEEVQDGVLFVLDERQDPLTEAERTFLKNESRRLQNHLKRDHRWMDTKRRLEMYEVVLSNAFQFMGTLNGDGEIVFGNQSALAFENVELEEVQGTRLWKSPWFDHSAEVREAIKQGVQRAMDGEFVQFETTTSSGKGRIVCIDFSLTPVLEDGEVQRIIAEGRDITERVEVTEELRRKNRRLRAIEASAPIGVSLGTTDGKVLTWNPECERIFGYAEDQAVGGRPPCLTATGMKKVQDALKTVRKGGKIDAREMKCETSDGETVYVRYSIAPVDEQSGNGDRVVFIFEDITERKKVREQLQEKERLLQKLIENIREVFYLVNLDSGGLIYVSPGVEEIWGRKRQELMRDRRNWLASVHEEDRRRVEKAMREQPQKPMDIKYRVVRPNGAIRWVHDKSYPIENEAGQVVMMGGICEDITERRAVKEDLERSLEQKQVLLEELHHRVKNNLQIISSLMNLQIPELPEAAKDRVLKIQSQVHALATLHETLYRSEHLTDVVFETYLEEIVRQLRSMYGGERTVIRLEGGALQSSIHLKHAVPCGLVVNELVANALKHAFDGEKGEIIVSLSLLEKPGANDRYEMKVEDNGAGFPDGSDPRNPEGFGLQLVQILVEGELQGSYSVRTGEDGTTFRIQFPASE